MLSKSTSILRGAVANNRQFVSLLAGQRSAGAGGSMLFDAMPAQREHFSFVAFCRQQQSFVATPELTLSRTAHSSRDRVWTVDHPLVTSAADAEAYAAKWWL
jgi:hypothetical protein